jgi:hypothetical protein
MNTRRIGITLLVAGLGAAAFFLARSAPAPDEGLVVHVTLLDHAGAPVPLAQVERVFAPGWEDVDGQGRRRLVDVALRAGEAPDAAAIDRAIRVRAPYHAARGGFSPAVTRRADGAWEARYTLHEHGVLRLYVEPTHHGEPKAWLEADEPHRRWEAMGAGNVARPGRPASYRIYPGLEEVAVRVAGEPDIYGKTAIATRRYLVKAPGAGHTSEGRLVPEPARPIVGRIALGDGAAPPTLAGVVLVVEQAPGGRRIPHDDVMVNADGAFSLPHAGSARYELTPVLDFFVDAPFEVVEGGADVLLAAGTPRPWAVLAHQGPDALSRPFDYRLRAPGGAWQAIDGALRGDGSTSLPLPSAGTWQIRADVPGTTAEPPLRLDAEVTAPAAGPVQADLHVTPVPHGTLLVQAAPGTLAQSGGLTVHLEDGRMATLLQGLAASVRIPHVPAGLVLVRGTWREPATAHEVALVEIEAGGTATAVLDRRPGGRLELGLPDAWEGVARNHVLRFGAGARGETKRLVDATLERRPGGRRWRVDFRFPAGDYEGALVSLDGGEEIPVAFRIEAGTTAVALVEATR